MMCLFSSIVISMQRKMRSMSASCYLLFPSLFISLLSKKRTKETILRERFSSPSLLILLRVASKLATLKQSRQSHYADFAGFPSRKPFQVGRSIPRCFQILLYLFLLKRTSAGSNQHPIPSRSISSQVTEKKIITLHLYYTILVSIMLYGKYTSLYIFFLSRIFRTKKDSNQRIAAIYLSVIRVVFRTLCLRR